MTVSKTFGTWLKTHLERKDELGKLASEFCSLKLVQDYVKQKDDNAYVFCYKDIKLPSNLYWLIKKSKRYFDPPENYNHIADLAAKQYSRYRRGMGVQFEVFKPYKWEWEIKSKIAQMTK